MSLPTTPSKNDLTTPRLRAILYGEPGAGKTTLAAQWHPSTNLIIDTEGGTRFLPGERFVMRPKTYSEFIQIVNDLVNQPHQFTTVTIDSIDHLIRMADAEAGQRGNKVAAGMVEYGKGLDDRDGTVMRDLGKLLGSDLGLILCAHDTEDNTYDEKGEKIISSKLVPLIDRRDRLRQPIIGLVDFELFIRKADHTIVTGGDPKLDVKRRVELPDELPADPQSLAAAIRAGVGALDRQPVAA